MNDLIETSDALIIHYYDPTVMTQQEFEKHKEVFKLAGVEFRTHMRERHTKGLELPRMVKFLEVNLNREELTGYMLKIPDADYPNTICLYMHGRVYAYNPWSKGFKTQDEVQNYLVAEWLRTTNAFLPKIDCDTFIENRENNVPMVILFDDWENLRRGKANYNANLAYRYD